MGTLLASHVAATAVVTCLLLAVLNLQRLAWGLRRMSRWAVASWDGRERRAAGVSAAAWHGVERRRPLAA